MNNKNIKKDKMADFDAEFVWHPYSSLTEPQPTYHVTGAKGARLYLDDGRELIDGVSSWWACCHGYGNEHLINKITEQLNKLSHVMFAGIRHDAATELVMRLKAILPQELKYVFLADSGSVAVEIAMKMAVQYQSSVNPRDTMATMSVTDPGTGFSAEYQQYIPQQFFIERPAIPFNDEWKQEAIEPLESFLSAHHDEIAAFILEPVMQGAGGMYFYHPMYLREARRLCSQYDVIMICDEIATGFGRTGRMFACEHAGIVPDIMTLGKGLTGGMMTLSAVAASEKIKDGIALSPARVLMHGPTFMANPLACAAALGSLDLLENNNVCEKTVHIQNVLEDGLRSISGLDVVREVRVLGACGVVELKFPVDTVRMQAFLVNHGVWLRPFGNIIYIYPPFIISDDELKKCIEAVKILVYRLEREENY